MHVVGFIIRIYHDARLPERQIWENNVKMSKNMFCCVVTFCNFVGPTVCRSHHTLSSGCKRQKRQVSPKRLCLSTKLHGVKSHKTGILMFIALGTTHFKLYDGC